MNGDFYIFDDKNKTREYIAFEFIGKKKLGKRINYFGSSGMGKSITLIGALKYPIDHSKFGTFYVNCKSLRVLTEKKNLN